MFNNKFLTDLQSDIIRSYIDSNLTKKLNEVKHDNVKNDEAHVENDKLTTDEVIEDAIHNANNSIHSDINGGKDINTMIENVLQGGGLITDNDLITGGATNTDIDDLSEIFSSRINKLSNEDKKKLLKYLDEIDSPEEQPKEVVHEEPTKIDLEEEEENESDEETKDEKISPQSFKDIDDYEDDLDSSSSNSSDTDDKLNELIKQFSINSPTLTGGNVEPVNRVKVINAYPYILKSNK